MASLVGQEISGRYQILEVLGQGGMAIVYKAHDKRLDREVAIKFIRSGSLDKKNAGKMLRRFEREAKALAKFSHPNIVKVYDYGEYEGDPFLVMEYLPGGTLKSRTGRSLPYREAAATVLPIARALAYAHNREVIHRDVKPANILFSETNEPILSDFGIAKLFEAEDGTALTATGVGIGTPEYMSPEQATGQQVDYRTDVYALGIVLYELVTGHKPFTGDTPVAVLLKHVQDPIPPARQFVPDLPDEFMRVLGKTLEKKPQERYPDMTAFADDLQELVGESRLPYAKPSSHIPETATVQLSEPGETKTSSSPSLPAVARIRTDSHPSILTGAVGESKSKRSWLIPVLIVLGVLIVGAIGLILLTGILLFSPTDASREKETGDNSASLTTSANLQFPPAGATKIIPKDDSIMVYVPAGEFTMGDPPSSPDEPAGEYRQHPVYLSPYWIDRTEVTNAAYEKFVADTGYKTGAEKAGESRLYDPQSKYWIRMKGIDWKHPQGPSSGIDGLEKHPVIHVDWNDAKAYCTWAGKRLPSEAEWEKAARGTDGRKYPWGDEPPAGNLTNVADQNIDLPWADKTFNDGQKFTSSIGSYPDGASPFGVLDMAGNVWEWVEDTYDSDFYLTSPYSDPINNSPGLTRVLRGGSWASHFPLASLRIWEIHDYREDSYGFRCALSALPDLPDKISQHQATATAITVDNRAKTYQEAKEVQVQATRQVISHCMQGVKTFGPQNYQNTTCDDYMNNYNNWYASTLSGDWGTSSSEFKDGKLIWETKIKQTKFLDNTLNSYVVDDFEAGLAAGQTAGSPNTACYGIVFRSYIDGFYYFEICENKRFAVSLSQGGQWKSLVSKTNSTAIIPDGTNWLSVTGKGSKFDIYVNGQRLTTLNDDTLPAGMVGIGVDVGENQDATFEFDKFFLRSP